jgi:hypothetical protein
VEALLVGTRGRSGKLKYVGRVEFGSFRRLMPQLKGLRCAESHFDGVRASARAVYVKPLVTATVKFLEASGDGLRHASVVFD